VERQAMSVHVINLDQDGERLAAFLGINAHLPEIVRFSAVDGRTADRRALEGAGIIANSLTYNNGQLGCALSHLALWRKAIEDGRPVTIAEDDAIFARNFVPARDAFLRDLPQDWSIVLWGWNFDRSVWAEIPEGVAKSVLHFDQTALRENIETFRHAEVAHAPVRLRHAFGIMAYTISPHGAKAMMDICLPLSRQFIGFEGFGIAVPNNGIDCVMNLGYPKLRAYVCMPPLAVSENRQEGSRTYVDF
jgi:glycosyl transferase family 25